MSPDIKDENRGQKKIKISPEPPPPYRHAPVH